MAISAISTIMLPVLKVFSGGEEIRTGDIPGLLSKTEGVHASKSVDLGLINAAVTQMQKAGLLERLQRGVFRLSSRGRLVLESGPDRIDYRYLRRFPEYVSYEKRRNDRKLARMPKPEPARESKPKPSYSVIPSLWESALDPLPSEKEQDPATPVHAKIVKSPYAEKPSPPLKRMQKRVISKALILEGAVKNAVQSLHGGLESQLLEEVSTLSGTQIVTLVMDVLKAMGVGGPAPTVTQIGLEEIGGAVLKDALGVPRMYVRVTESNRATVQDLELFRLGLAAACSRNGVMVTSVGSTDMAEGFAAGSARSISLLDHEELVYLMVTTGVGVTEDRCYRIRHLDETFFSAAASEST